MSDFTDFLETLSEDERYLYRKNHEGMRALSDKERKEFNLKMEILRQEATAALVRTLKQQEEKCK